MEFKKKLKQRLYIAVSYIVIGLGLMAADAVSHFENTFIFPFGVVMLVMGVMRIFRYRKIAKDEKTMKKQELSEKDERLLMISERAKSWVFSFSLMVSGYAVIVLSLLGKHEAALPFAWYLCGMTVLYWICWNIIRKKY